MIQKTEIEQQKAAVLKAFRTAIRLKHSLAADKEINERLPQVEADIDTALAEGRPLELTLGELLDAA